MSTLRVDKIISRFENQEVEVMGLKVGEYPIEMDTADEDFVLDGTCVYQDDKFRFKQDGVWITLGGGCCDLDDVTSLGAVTTNKITVGELKSTGDIESGGDIFATSGSIVAKKFRATSIGIEFPDGTIQTTACDCIDELGDVPDVAIPEVSTDIEINSYLKFDHTLEVWYPDIITTADIFDLCCETPNDGDILVWSAADECWEAVAHVGGGSSLSFVTWQLAADAGFSWGSGNVVADSTSDTLTLVAGSNITIETDSGSDAIKISASGGGGGGADNLGNHQATQNLEMLGHWVSHDGADAGMFVDGTGQVGIGTNAPEELLDVAGWTFTDHLKVGEDVPTLWASDNQVAINWGGPFYGGGAENVLDIRPTPGSTDGNIQFQKGGKVIFNHTGMRNTYIFNPFDKEDNIRVTTNGTRRIEVDRFGKTGFGVWTDLEGESAGATGTGATVNIATYDSGDRGGLWIKHEESSMGSGRSALHIDSNNNVAIKADFERGLDFEQVTAGGWGSRIRRDNDDDEVYPLVSYQDLNTNNTQTTLRVQQNGIGDIFECFDDSDSVLVVTDGGSVGYKAPVPQQHIDMKNEGGFHTSKFVGVIPGGGTHPEAVIASVSAADFRSYKVFVTVKDPNASGAGPEFTSTTAVVIHDGSGSAFHSEYGRIETVSPPTHPLGLHSSITGTGELELKIIMLGNGLEFEGTAVITALQGDL